MTERDYKAEYAALLALNEQISELSDELHAAIARLCQLNGVDVGDANVATLERLVEALGGRANPSPGTLPAWCEAVDPDVLLREPSTYTCRGLQLGPVQTIQHLSKQLLETRRFAEKLAELRPPPSGVVRDGDEGRMMLERAIAKQNESAPPKRGKASPTFDGTPWEVVGGDFEPYVVDCHGQVVASVSSGPCGGVVFDVAHVDAIVRLVNASATEGA